MFLCFPDVKAVDILCISSMWHVWHVLSLKKCWGRSEVGGWCHPPVITVFIGGMFTIPSHSWFMTLFYPQETAWLGVGWNHDHLRLNKRLRFHHISSMSPWIIVAMVQTAWLWNNNNPRGIHHPNANLKDAVLNATYQRKPHAMRMLIIVQSHGFAGTTWLCSSLNDFNR